MDEVTAKRLAVVRHLYQQGVRLSQTGEPTNGLSVLSFHDSVEMFMKICADAQNIRIDRKTNFMDYFEKVPNMKCKAQMDKLNNQRVGLKHHGTIPSTLDVEISRTNVADFFQQNCSAFFGVTLRRVLWNGFKKVLMQKWLMVELSDLLSSVLMLNSEIPLANSKKSRSFAIEERNM